MVPEAGIEPARPKWAQDFKSGASTYSATQALNPFYKKSRLSIGTLSGKRDSNSRPRPWQGRALPTELFPRFGFATAKVRTFFNLPKFFEEIFKKFLSPPPNQLYHCLKFPEEPYIILKIVAQILNLPFEHCNSLHTHTECKA